MSDSAVAALEVDGLSVRYGGNLAVDPVRLSPPGGAATRLIGPHGAGQTTSLHPRCGPPPPRPAGALSTGQRRLVELARAYAGEYRLLLLDEPSSGLDRAESERLGEILRRMVDDRGIGILLVEHDMVLVMSACEHLFVLDF